jgi:hypothetical protein
MPRPKIVRWSNGNKSLPCNNSFTPDQQAGTRPQSSRQTGGLRWQSQQLSLSNAALLKSRIHNMKRMDSRRVAFTIGVTYDTSEPELRAIPGLIAGIVRAQPQESFGRAHFAGPGPSSLNFEVAWTRSRGPGVTESPYKTTGPGSPFFNELARPRPAGGDHSAGGKTLITAA